MPIRNLCRIRLSTLTSKGRSIMFDASGAPTKLATCGISDLAWWESAYSYTLVISTVSSNFIICETYCMSLLSTLRLPQNPTIDHTIELQIDPQTHTIDILHCTCRKQWIRCRRSQWHCSHCDACAYCRESGCQTSAPLSNDLQHLKATIHVPV